MNLPGLLVSSATMPGVLDRLPLFYLGGVGIRHGFKREVPQLRFFIATCLAFQSGLNFLISMG